MPVQRVMPHPMLHPINGCIWRALPHAWTQRRTMPILQLMLMELMVWMLLPLLALLVLRVLLVGAMGGRLGRLATRPSEPSMRRITGPATPAVTLGHVRAPWAAAALGKAAAVSGASMRLQLELAQRLIGGVALGSFFARLPFAYASVLVGRHSNHSPKKLTRLLI